MKRNSIKRKWKRIITAATAAALMASSLGTLTAAAAAEPIDQVKDAQVKVIKSFETNYAGEGAVNTFPELTFAFQFTADQGESSSKDDIPVIGDKSVTVPASANQESKKVETGGQPDKWVLTLETGNVLEGIQFPHAGLYVYDVVEKNQTYTLGDFENLTCSDEKYKMYVYVANIEEGMNVGTTAGNRERGIYISSVELFKYKEDGIIDKGQIEDYKAPELKFTNTFYRTASLKVTNTTVGKYANKDKEFSYSLTLGQNPAFGGKDSYTVKVVKGGETQTPQTLTIKPGETITDIMLADGDYFEMDPELPEGITYTAVETLALESTDPYSSKILDIYYNDRENQKNSLTGNQAIKPDSGDTELTGNSHTIRYKHNQADFHNTNDITPLTGIIMNNLPFMLLILAAAGLFILLIVAGRYRRSH